VLSSNLAQGIYLIEATVFILNAMEYICAQNITQKKKKELKKYNKNAAV